MANERIFGQEADTQLLESLGVFSMVDKTQRTEFINSTVSEINSAYKQLHELQMGYISQQHQQRIKNEAQLIEMQIKSIRVLSKDYDDIYRKRLDYLQKEVDKTVQMSKDQAKAQQDNLKTNFDNYVKLANLQKKAQEEHRKREQANINSLNEYTQNYIDQIYGNQDEITKRFIESSKKAGQQAAEKFKASLQENDISVNVSSDVIDTALKQVQQKAYDNQMQILEKQKSIFNGFISDLKGVFTNYLLPGLGLTSFGSVDIRGSLQRGNDTALQVRNTYGRYGMDNAQQLGDAMAEASKSLQERGFAVTPSQIFDLTRNLDKSYALAYKSHEDQVKMLESLLSIQEGVSNLDYNSNEAKNLEFFMGSDTGKYVEALMSKIAEKTKVDASTLIRLIGPDRLSTMAYENQGDMDGLLKALEVAANKVVPMVQQGGTVAALEMSEMFNKYATGRLSASQALNQNPVLWGSMFAHGLKSNYLETDPQKLWDSAFSSIYPAMGNFKNIFGETNAYFSELGIYDAGLMTRTKAGVTTTELSDEELAQIRNQVLNGDITSGAYSGPQLINAGAETEAFENATTYYQNKVLDNLAVITGVVQEGMGAFPHLSDFLSSFLGQAAGNLIGKKLGIPSAGKIFGGAKAAGAKGLTGGGLLSGGGATTATAMLGKVVPIAAGAAALGSAAFDAVEAGSMADGSDATKKAGVAAVKATAGIGAILTGAAVGTAVTPVVGTVVGAAVGALTLLADPIADLIDGTTQYNNYIKNLDVAQQNYNKTLESNGTLLEQINTTFGPDSTKDAQKQLEVINKVNELLGTSYNLRDFEADRLEQTNKLIEEQLKLKEKQAYYDLVEKSKDADYRGLYNSTAGDNKKIEQAASASEVVETIMADTFTPYELGTYRKAANEKLTHRQLEAGVGASSGQIISQIMKGSDEQLKQKVANLQALDATSDQIIKYLESGDASVLSNVIEKTNAIVDEQKQVAMSGVQEATNRLDEIFTLAQSTSISSDLFNGLDGYQINSWDDVANILNKSGKTTGDNKNQEDMAIQRLYNLVITEQFLKDGGYLIKGLSWIDKNYEALYGSDSNPIRGIVGNSFADYLNSLGVIGYQFAQGISAVPYNGFPAILHQGEMVIPSKKANYIRALFGQKPLPTSGVPETQLTGNNSFVQSIPNYTQGQTPMGPQDDSGMSFAYGDDAVGVMKKMASQGVTYGQMDCSDSVSDAYIKAGVGVPDSNCRGIYKWDQYGFGFIYDAKKNNGSLLSKQGLSQLSILPGDVILMDLNSGNDRYPDHVSLATGGGKMIHSYKSWDPNGRGGPHESGYWNGVVAVLRYGSGGTGESSLDLSNINYVSGNSTIPGGAFGLNTTTGLNSIMDLATAQTEFANILNFYGYGDLKSLYSALMAGATIATPNGKIGGGIGSTSYPITGNLTDGSALESNTYRDLIYKYSEKHGLDPRIVYGMIMTESSGNPNAISSGGRGSYKGLMQVNQGKVDALFGPGANIFDPETNIATGTNYLESCIRKTGSVVTGVGGYNTGPGYRAWKNLATAISSSTEGQDLASIMQAGGFLVVSDGRNMSGNPKNIKTSYITSVYKNAGYPLQVPYLAKGGIVDSPTLAMIGEGPNNEAVTPLNRDNQLLGLDNMTNSLLDGMDELCGHILNKLNEVISAINSINTGGGDIQRAQAATSRARQFKQSSMGNVGY